MSHAQVIAKAMYVISLVALFLSAFIVAVFLYWEFFPKTILTYPDGTILPVKTQTVKAGSYLKYQLRYCKSTEDVSTIFETLVGQNVYTLAPTQRDLPPGCQDRTISDIYIPTSVPPGTYTLHITVVYHPNPVRTVQYYVQTTPFVVTN